MGARPVSVTATPGLCRSVRRPLAYRPSADVGLAAVNGSA
jgi:hypothetical protein